MHARSGGSIEVMGLLIGTIEEGTMIVTDSFALPVEGTGKIEKNWEKNWMIN